MKKFGKRALALLLSCFLLVGTVSVATADEGTVVASEGGITVYEDYYKEMPNVLAEKGLTVEGNTINGSDFTVEMGEEHHYKFDSSRGTGLVWWNEKATATNSGLKFGFPAVNSGILRVTYRFWTSYDGNFGSLINGTLAEHTKVVEVVRAENKIGEATSSAGEGNAVTVQTIADFENGIYQVKVGKTLALTGTLAENAQINGVYFDIVEGQEGWGVVEGMKVEVSDASKATFVDVTGAIIDTADIEGGQVTVPEYNPPEGSNLMGWKDIYGNVVEDFTNVTGGMIYTAILDKKTIEVTNEDELKAAIANAPTDGTKLEIVLTNDIDAWGTLNFPENTDIILKGAYTLKKIGTHENDYIKAQSGTKLTIEDVTIDMNAAALEKGGRAVAVTNNGIVTLTGNAVIKDGWVKNNDCAVYLNGGNAVFKMEGNSKITGFTPKADATVTGLIGCYFSGKFIMDGGEISGNTIITRERVNPPSGSNSGTTGGGIIYVPNGTKGVGNSYIVYLNGGKIVDNTWTGTANNYIYEVGFTNNSQYRGVYLGGNTELDGKLYVDMAVRITGTMTKPATIEWASSIGGVKIDDHGNQKSDYYGTVIADGYDGYVLEQADVDNIIFSDPEYYAYLDTIERWNAVGSGKIYLQDIGKEPPAESGIILPSSYQPPAEWTVTFYDGDRTTPIDVQTVLDGQSAVAPTTIPTMADSETHSYEFAGWEDYTNITADRAVYPIFNEIPLVTRYKVTFYDGNGEILEEQMVKEGEAATAPTPVAPTGGTYIFKGWDTDFTNVKSDIEVHPIYKAQYTVRFYSYGTKITEVKVAEGDAAEAPTAPAKTDSEFTGWDKDITNITANIDVHAVYEYVGDPTVPYEVSTLAQLQEIMTIAPKDGRQITIKLLNNIETTDIWNGLTGCSGEASVLKNGKNIVIDGQGYTIKKGAQLYHNYGICDSATQRKGWIVVEGATLELKDVTIDVNDVRNDENQMSTTALYVGTNATVTLSGNAVLKGGIGRKGRQSMAVYIEEGTFIMEDNAKITEFMSSYFEDSAGNSVIGFNGHGGKFIMNGGEISGNRVKEMGIIGGEGKNNDNNADIILNAGKIINNEWDTDNKYAVYMITNNGTGAFHLGGGTEIEGLIGGNSNAFAPKITGELLYPITVGGFDIGRAGDKRDDSNNEVEGCYGGAIVVGTADYTLTANDLLNVSYDKGTNYADVELELYLDVRNNHNGVFAMNEGTTKKYDEWILKSEATPVAPALFGISDVIESEGNLVVSYGLNEGATEFATANIQGMPAVAIYKGDMLVAVTYDTNASVALSAENAASTISVKAPTDWTTNANDYTVKVFIWDAATIAPVVDVAVK